LARIKEVFGRELSPEEALAEIIAAVRSRGNAAVLEYTKRLDGVALASLEATRQETQTAYGAVSQELLGALRLAAGRVRSFHEAAMSSYQRPVGELGLLVRPLERVGIYVPGGTASYPSTVLMTVVPAKVAGVEEVVVATPPRPDGTLPAATLVAADIAGVDRLFKVGGAQAIAALALGTESIPRVDKVCGPGNIFVTLAKKQVYGLVDIDGLYGPTETVIVADDSASLTLCAADLLAQAEHDEAASAILIATSVGFAQAVSDEVERQLEGLERGDIARAALEHGGGIAVVESVDEAVDLANHYAPEHLCLMVQDARSYIGRVRHAGGLFIGESSPEALGDYVAGPSHVMPTGGTARFASPLGVAQFLKDTALVALSEAALKELGPAAAAIARAEGLTAHARALELRLGG